MSVQAFGEQFDGNGFDKSWEAHVTSHVQNSNALLNLAEGKKMSTLRPFYDPSHPDNQWPLMLHHPAKGELAVGTNLKGVSEPLTRQRIQRENEAAVKGALAGGYRREPYLKPQVAVMDPAAEKQALLRRNQELEGQLATTNDMLQKLSARLDAMEQGAAK